MKKAIYSFVALSMVYFQATAAKEMPYYSDIDGHWGKVAVEWATQNHVVKGYQDGTFKPNQPVTEAEFIAMLIRIFPNSNDQWTIFEQEESSEEHWSNSYYRVAEKFNVPVLNQPNEIITRGLVAQIITGALGKNYDVEGSISYLYDMSLSNGRGEKTIQGFEANGSLTRAEAVQFLKGLVDSGLTKELLERSPQNEQHPNVVKYKPKRIHGTAPTISEQQEREAMFELNCGKYEVPDTLNRIISLQHDLNQAGFLQYGDLLGYYFGREGLDSRYLNTPLDVIAFARPGVDGIHYGFLTDFGSVKQLEEVYIVRVSPMDFDEPVKIVARNIHDFMRILCYTPIALDLVDTSTSEDDFKQLVTKYPELALSQIDDHNPVNEIFKETFQLEPIPDIYAYMQKIKEERSKEMSMVTDDGIGVVNKTDQNVELQLMGLQRHQSLKLEEIEGFFKDASYISKLGFLRDAQSKGLLFDNNPVKSYLKEQLMLMNLQDEAERLAHSVE